MGRGLLIKKMLISFKKVVSSIIHVASGSLSLYDMSNGRLLLAQLNLK
jgi:hypothetical protein